MKLTERTVSRLLADFRSSEPTPGGGSAAALAGAVGASLLAMVAALPKARTTNESDVQRLGDAGRQCEGHARELEALVDRDSESYEAVVGAFRLPKSTEAEKSARSAAIQQAMIGATETPLEVMRTCARALALAPVVSELGNPNAASDVEVGILLLSAGIRGAQQNVEINLGSVKDEHYAAGARKEVEELVGRAVR